MFSTFFIDLEYREYMGKTDSGQEKYGMATTIKGIRLKGQYKVTNDGDGDTTTANISYKVDRKLTIGGKLEGRVVVDCYPVNGLFLQGKCGYIAYVK